jgi:hypothetical protein
MYVQDIRSEYGYGVAQGFDGVGCKLDPSFLVSERIRSSDCGGLQVSMHSVRG